MRSRLILILYSLDPENQVFSHQAEIAKRLAGSFSRVDIVSLLDSDYKLPPIGNIFVHNVAWNSNRPKLINLFSVLRSLICALRIGAIRDTVVLSHMTDLPSALLSPLTRLLRIPHILWYAHSNYSIYLRISSLFVNRILTSTSGSCPYRGKKLSVIGQMVDENLFLPNRTRDYFQFLKILHVGRLDPSKNVKEVILTFLQLFGQNDSATLSLIGTPTYSNERYLIDLKKEFGDEIGQGKIMFLGKLGRDEVVQRMNSSDLLLHAYQGSLDKVLVEAVLLELPVVSTNLEFNRIFGFDLERAGKLSHASLSEECKVLLEAPKEEIVNSVKLRREVALQEHSLGSWITRVLRELESF